MLSSVIVTVTSIPSFSRVVIRLFWFIKRHLWVTRSASRQADCGSGRPTAEEVVMNNHSNMEVRTESYDEKPRAERDDISTIVDLEEVYRSSSAFPDVMVMVWDDEHDTECAASRVPKEASSPLDDVVIKATANELDLLFSRVATRTR